MSDYMNIVVEKEEAFAWVSIDRPKVQNAFDGETLRELTDAFRSFTAEGTVRVVFLAGKNGIFSAGADLSWMKGGPGAGPKDFEAGSRVLADALRALDACPLPTVALAEKAVMGGAMGLLCACDFALASEGTQFRSSEVRLGIVPAVVGPYVLRQLGDRATRELFLMGETIDAKAAHRIGLVHRVVPGDELIPAGKTFVAPLLKGGPRALASVKTLLSALPRMAPDEASRYTAKLIAGLRAGEEGQEGMGAFLEKRKPKWSKR